MDDLLSIGKEGLSLLCAPHWGLERESLRIERDGGLSQKNHPHSLGSPLTHPYIRTDFGEQQLEWNTPPLSSFRQALCYLEDVLSFSAQKMGEELFWPYSMPPHLCSVQVAQFGSSSRGREKELYRLGLQGRYGTNLQMISGVHCNFSFQEKLWQLLRDRESSPLSIQDFASEKYLAMIRNFLREGWLLTYLFGASPVMDPSYSSLPENFMRGIDYYYAPWATSIRTSNLGYYSRVQNQLAISFNTLPSYLAQLKKAVSTPNKEYLAIKQQLNAHFLQLENEHYSRIRPKRGVRAGETPIEALERKGIEYLEIRTIDLDPSIGVGVSKEQLEFIHLFLIYCLGKKSPQLTKQMEIDLACNQNRVALQGRDPDLLLTNHTPIGLRTWANTILDAIAPLAPLLGYEKTFALQRNKVENPLLTPSAALLQSIKEKGLKEKMLTWATRHKRDLQGRSIPPRRLRTFEEHIQTSHRARERLETEERALLKGYQGLELSTQVLIRKALQRGVHVEVLDAQDQLLRLERGGHVEYVKEATKTSKDSYITPFLLENKEVTKNLLAAQGLEVPLGKSYSSLEEAYADSSLGEKQVVIKPKSANFGLGVHFAYPRDKEGYRVALQKAFAYGSSVLVEEFIMGEELRFLVIDYKVVAIAKREPAHVVGDGEQAIRKLVHAKNFDPRYYRDPKNSIRLGISEREMLREQKLDAGSVPRRGKKIYLRRNSNVSTGGDPIDRTDEVHEGYRDIATQATKILGAKVCGIDIIIAHPKQAPKKKGYAIIELNYNPVLFIHDHPYRGQRRDVAGPLLDLLGYPLV